MIYTQVNSFISAAQGDGEEEEKRMKQRIANYGLKLRPVSGNSLLSLLSLSLSLSVLALSVTLSFSLSLCLSLLSLFSLFSLFSLSLSLSLSVSSLSLLSLSHCFFNLGDGNCQMRAIADQMWGEEARHVAVRNSIVRYVFILRHVRKLNFLK